MLGLGYPKADRIMGVLEERGIVSAPQGNRRTLLVNAGAHPIAGALPASTPAAAEDLASKIPTILPPGSENR
jgi:DNA segregation ATPase FtsK/SpoIIIE-like protein